MHPGQRAGSVRQDKNLGLTPKTQSTLQYQVVLPLDSLMTIQPNFESEVDERRDP